MAVKKDKVSTKKFNESLLIYLGGYATHKNITLKDWFNAREYVNNNKQLYPKF
jgi:hypothetical protein